MEYKEKIAVMGDADMVMGFALAGVAERIIVTPENCEEKFLEAIQREEIGILIIQDDLAQGGFSHKTKKLVETLSRPVLVTVPGKNEVLSGKKSGNIQELVKRAIGIELKT